MSVFSAPARSVLQWRCQDHHFFSFIRQLQARTRKKLTQNSFFLFVFFIKQTYRSVNLIFDPFFFSTVLFVR
jgi:hypothetical protein